jgi:hypothetical protein
MAAWMWRLNEHTAVIYTNDRSTLDQVLGYARFPHKDLKTATTYAGKNGKVFAWQFTFPQGIWNGVVRHLGRARVVLLDVDPPHRKPKGTASVPPAAVPAARRSVATRGVRRMGGIG